ncbi:MAG: S41 family peptidase [Phycisphaerales bacterium]
MTPTSLVRRLSSGLLALAIGASLITAGPAAARQPSDLAVATPATVGDLSQRIWSGALNGDARTALLPLDAIPATTTNGELLGLRESSAALDSNLKKYDQSRQAKLTQAWDELEKHLAEPESYSSLSKSLKSAVEAQLLSTDHQGVLKDPRIAGLIKRADAFARAAEGNNDWLVASDLFFKLNALLDEEGTYRNDAKRLADRLELLRMYVPERLWELRADLAKQLGEKPIPPYNKLGEEYSKKLERIDDTMMMKAIKRSAEMQVDRTTATYGDMLSGGLDAIQTLVTTHDLQRVFPEIGNTDARKQMLDYLGKQREMIQGLGKGVNDYTMINLVDGLRKMNHDSVKLPDEALLHEFGNGAMAKLDEFSAIIWPDEKARFERMTQGEFTGVGVQIQFDEASQCIKVVTPLDDTPAQRAGVHAGDLIKKINGDSAVGLSLNQAVDLITGPKGSPVTITVERGDKEIDFHLLRGVIPVVSVKGWKRTGPRDDDWDWYIDPDRKIGYVRLLQFTDDTTSKLHAAIRNMKETGLNGLILDLRFNPGGLLTQAVSVANTFVERGEIVSTTSGDRQLARSSRNLVKDIPIAVLINEGSASASEIVSGAIKHYADTKQIRAVLIGARSYGKGSVQNVWPLDNTADPAALLKLTTQYYKVPDGTAEGYILHRRPGAKSWGIDAHLKINMLPDQIADAIKLRQDADVLPIDETGKVMKDAPAPPDPSKLLADGIDLQLQTALVVLQAQAVSQNSPRASLN